MKLIPTVFAGLHIIEALQLKDDRGYFVKTFNQSAFADSGVIDPVAEIYYSYSHQGAIRGLHFQRPPHQHSKIVFCLAGKIFDACVDLRKNSKTYGQYFTMELSGDVPKGLYIPAGFAHGFLALSGDVLFMNATSTVYAGESDGGIAWDSCGIQWPATPTLVSPKDQILPKLAEYESPF